MSKCNETIYWKFKSDSGVLPRWKTDSNGQVVMAQPPAQYPCNEDGERMTITDMDLCPKVVRCRHDGLPLDSVEVSDA